MDSLYLTDPRSSRNLDRLAVLVAGSLFASITMAAIFWLVRRYCGGVQAPLSTFALVLCGIVLALIVLASQFVVERLYGDIPSRGKHILAIALSGVSALLVAWALSHPGSSAWGLLALWGFALGGAVVAIRRPIARLNPPLRIRQPPREPPLEEELSPDVNQRWTRRREPDGADVIEGWVRADFTAGARVAAVYAAFCPPYASTPLVEAEAVDGPQAGLKIGPVYPHGARVEIRLERLATEPASVVIALLARGVGAPSSPS